MFKKWLWYNLSSIILIIGNLCLVPLTTYKLNSTDFAYFGLITSITVVGANLSAFGFNFVLSKNIAVKDRKAIISTISTLFWFGLIITIIFGVLLLATWNFIALLFKDIEKVPKIYLYISIMTNILSFPGVLLFEYLRIKGESFQWSIITVLQFLVSSSMTLFFIYALDFQALALFVGPLSGAIVAMLISFYFLKSMIRLTYSLDDLKYLLSLGRMSLLSSSAENLYSFFERLTIVRFLGEVKLGIFIHSLYYRQIGLSVAGAFSNSIWPETLSEANDTRLHFKKTTKFWFFVYMLLGIGGIISVLFGKEILDVLTHGKFTEASLLIPFWIIFLLVQHSGRSHVGLMFAKGHGVKYLQFNLIRIATCVVLVYLFIVNFSILGIVFASILSMLFFRILMYVYCHNRYKTNFEDWYVLFWISAVLILLLFNTIFHIILIFRIFLLLIIILFTFYHSLKYYSATRFVKSIISIYTGLFKKKRNKIINYESL